MVEEAYARSLKYCISSKKKSSFLDSAKGFGGNEPDLVSNNLAI